MRGLFYVSIFFMFVLLMPGLAGLGADPLAVRETESAKVENYCITGYAQTAGGSPAIGVIIFLFPYKDEKAFSPIVRDKDGHFRLGCPGGKIDKTGKFAIKFSSDYLKSYQTSKFVLGVFRVDGGADISIGIGEKPGTPIFGFDSFGKDKKLDLTQIFPKIIISLSPEISSIEPSRDIKF